ncbi:epoxide hydrolase N terminus-domain-containing protein [Hypoxylon cercidicola]|nr:epoxide hydrolase N terminus-domain-containing protein [Hypoxylon cercidicola]
MKDPKRFVVDRKYGVTSDWLAEVKAQWEKFDWRKVEDEINSFPNYTSKIEESGDTFDIHFAALFSERTDAIPILMLHGWPRSFLEFLPILKLLKGRYTPQTLPYHIILGFSDGYVTQGGDVGSGVARILGALQPRAKAVHLNFSHVPDPGKVPDAETNDAERAGVL